MKTKIVLLFAVALIAAQLSQPMFAVPITYSYTGNPFTTATAPYTTSDKVTGSVTLAAPLGANMSFTLVVPLAFSFSDGVQTITNLSTPLGATFEFETGPTGAITGWEVGLFVPVLTGNIQTFGNFPFSIPHSFDAGAGPLSSGANQDAPGTWSTRTTVPDTGSTLSLMTLALMALGLVARPFKRAAA
jgi:hypothetical protein